MEYLRLRQVLGRRFLVLTATTFCWMSLPVIGIAAPQGYPPAHTQPRLSKEEQALASAQRHQRVFARIRQEEEEIKKVKAERKRIKKEGTGKTKVPTKVHTPKPRKNKARRVLKYLKVKVFRRKV